MLKNPKDKPSGGESLSRWQSRTASEMQACLAGQVLLLSPKGLECNTHPTPGGGNFVFSPPFYFLPPHSLYWLSTSMRTIPLYG